MIWQAMLRWFLAGCLSASALNLAVDYPEKAEPVQEGLRPALSDSVLPSPASGPDFSTPVSLSPQPAPEIFESSKAGVNHPPPAAISSTAGEYKIQPEDILQITVYEEPDLTSRVRVSGSGEINFPLLGRIKVSGLSVSETQEKVTKLLEADYLVNPQIQVFILAYHARNVFITGAVDRPGSYPLAVGRPTTLMEAVTMAGGFTEKAAVNNARIIRIENGKETTLRVRANDIIKKGDKSKDVEVLPGDVIFIPESFF